MPLQRAPAHRRPDMRRYLGALAVISLVVLFPSALYAQATIAGTVQDASGAVLPGVAVEAASPELISADGRHRCVRPVPDREPAARHLQRHVHAARLQHLQARRAGALGHVRRFGQRRAEGRFDRGDDQSPERLRSSTSRAPNSRRWSATRSSPRCRPRVATPRSSRSCPASSAARATCRPALCLRSARTARPGGPFQRRGADDARRPAHFGAAGQLLELHRRHP